ncbi:hypothetical protein PVMG_03170 [Plasmodium vivax Mauritania I]|uniref:Regulator of chromosome condensation n=1 Tax=Plasmodium vivax Mauritania I TaxID=1035515 RepID=A0A0J9W1M5_PLAVI|nr:hypothetical protein PVMG_03170 [Plasmodium vivax Mauritania I]
MSGEKRGSKIHVFVINDVKNEEGEKEELDDAYNTEGDAPKGGNPNGEAAIGGDKQKVINPKKNKKEEIIRHKMYHPQVKIVKVSCGKSIIGFLSVVGKIYCWQLNGFDDFDKNVPYLLVDSVLKNKIIHDVSSGDSHIAFLSKEGELFTYGDNTYGQLGNGDDASFECEDGLASEAVHPFSALEDDLGGQNPPEEVDTKEKRKKQKGHKVHKVDVQNNIVKYVYSRDRYTLYLTIDGFLYGFGLINEHFLQGQKNRAKRKRVLTKPCLIDTNNIAFKKIAIGNNFILGISFNNSLYSWGDNTGGVLGYDDCAECHEPKLVETIKNVTYVSAGRVSLCKTVEDDLYIWGGNYGCKPSMVKNKFDQMIINRNFIIGLCAKKNIWVKKIDTLSHGYYINNLRVDLLCSYDNLIIGVENQVEGELEPVHADAKVAIRSCFMGKGKDQGGSAPLGGNDLAPFAKAAGDAHKDSRDNIEEALTGGDVEHLSHDVHAHLSGGNVPPQQGKGGKQGHEQEDPPNDHLTSTAPTAGKVPPAEVRKDAAQNSGGQGGKENRPPSEEEKSNGIPQVGSKESFAKMNQFECEEVPKGDPPKGEAANAADVADVADAADVADETDESHCMEAKSLPWNEKESTTHETEPSGNTYHKLTDAEMKEDDYFDEDYYGEDRYGEDRYSEEEHFLATNFYGKPETPNLSDAGGGLSSNGTSKGKEKLNLKSALKKFPSSERLKKSVSFSNYVYDLARSNYELMSGASSGEEAVKAVVAAGGVVAAGEVMAAGEPVGVDVEANHAGIIHPPDEDIFVNVPEKMPNGNPSEDKFSSQFIWDDPPQECTSEETSVNKNWDNVIAGKTAEEGCPPLVESADRIGSEIKMYVGNLQREEVLEGDTKCMLPFVNDSDKVAPLGSFPSEGVDMRCTNWGGTLEEENSYTLGGYKGGFTFERRKCFPSEGHDVEWGLSQRGAPMEGASKEGKKNEKVEREVSIEQIGSHKGGFKHTGEYHIVGSHPNESYQHVDGHPSAAEIIASGEGKRGSGFAWNGMSTTLSGEDADSFFTQNQSQRIGSSAKLLPLRGDKGGETAAGVGSPTVGVSLKKKNLPRRSKNLQGRKTSKIKHLICKRVTRRVIKKRLGVPNEVPPVGTKLTLSHPPQVEREKMTKLKVRPSQLRETKKETDRVDPPLGESSHVSSASVIGTPSHVCHCCGGRSPRGVNLQAGKKKDTTHKRGDPGRVPLEDSCKRKTSLPVNKKAAICESNPPVKEKKTLQNDNAAKMKISKTGKKQVSSRSKDKPACSGKGCSSKGGVQSGPLRAVPSGGSDQNGANGADQNGENTRRGCPAQEGRTGRKGGAAKVRRNSSAASVYQDGVCQDVSEEITPKGSKVKRSDYFSDTEKRTSPSDRAYSGNTSGVSPIRKITKRESCASCHHNGILEVGERKGKANSLCVRQTGERENYTDASFHLENHPLSRGEINSCAGGKYAQGRLPSLERDTCWGEGFTSFDRKLDGNLRGVEKGASRCHSEGGKANRASSKVVRKRSGDKQSSGEQSSGEQSGGEQRSDKQRSGKQSGGTLPGERKTQPSGETQLARLSWTSDQDLCSHRGGGSPHEANSHMVRLEAGETARTSPKKKLKRKTSEGALCLYGRSGSNERKVGGAKVGPAKMGTTKEGAAKIGVAKKGKQSESAEAFASASKKPVSNYTRQVVALSGSKGSAKGGKMARAEDQHEIALADEEGKKKQKKIASPAKRVSGDSNDGSGRDVLKKLGKQIRRMRNDIAMGSDLGKDERGKGKGVKNAQRESSDEIEPIDGEYLPQADAQVERLYRKVKGKLRGGHVDKEMTPLGKEKKKRMKKLLKDVQYIYEEYKSIKKEKEENEKKKNYLKKVLESTVMKTNQVIRHNKSSFEIYINKMRKENLFLKNELDEESHQHHYDLQQLVNKITHLEQVKDLIARQNEELTKRVMTLTIECEKCKKREVEVGNALDTCKQNLEKEKKKKKYILRKIEHSLKGWEADYNELKGKYNSVQAQNGQLLKRSGDLSQRNEDLSQRNEDLSQRNEDLAKRNEELAKRNEQLREEARAWRRELHVRKDLLGGRSAEGMLSRTPRGENKSKPTEAKQELHLEEGNAPKGEAASTHLAFLKERLKQKWDPSKGGDVLVDPILEGIIQMALNHLGVQSGQTRGSGAHLSSVHPAAEDRSGAANLGSTANRENTTNTGSTANQDAPKKENLKVATEQMEQTMTSIEGIEPNCSHGNEEEEGATTQQEGGHPLPSNETVESKTGTYDTSSEIHEDLEDSFSLQTITPEEKLETDKKNSTKGETQTWVTRKVNYTPSASLTGLTHTTHGDMHSQLANETAEKVNSLDEVSGVLQWGDDHGQASQTGDRLIANAFLERKKKKKKKPHSGKDNHNGGEAHEANEHPLDGRLLKTKIRGLNEKSATKGVGVNGSTVPSNEVTTKALSKKNTQLKEIQKNDFLLLHDSNRINKNDAVGQIAATNDASTERRKVTHAGEGQNAKRAVAEGTHKQNGSGDNSKEKQKELNDMLDCIFDTSSDHSSISANMVDIQSLIESNLKNIFSAQD